MANISTILHSDGDTYVWDNYNGSYRNDIYMQHFDENGTPSSDQIMVNTIKQVTKIHQA